MKPRSQDAEFTLEEYKATMAANAGINAAMREEAKSEHFLQRNWRTLLMLVVIVIVVNNYILYTVPCFLFS